MLKTNLIVFFLLFSTSKIIADTEKLQLAENNVSKKANNSFNLLKINNHLITSDIFPIKKANALRYKFKKNEKKAILNQLINDEIAIQYAFNYLKLEDNITNEIERRNYGLTLIHKIATKEIFLSISDDNASSYYKTNQQDFWHKKNFRASHILVKDKNTSLKLLEELQSSKNLNDDFQRLAKKYSTGPSSKKGGYLGYFESSIMVQPFKDAIEKLTIGKYCSFAARVSILLGGEHRLDMATTFPFAEIPEPWSETKALPHMTGSKGDISIGNDVWIGHGTTILSGVTIGDGAVLGASAMVCRNIAPYSIVGGNPAKTIKMRFADDTISRLMKLAWWDWSEEKVHANIHLICSPDIESLLIAHGC